MNNGCIIAFACCFAFACGDSNNTEPPKADVVKELECHEYSAENCPRDRCGLVEGTDLSHDRDAETPSCEGEERVSLCTQYGDGVGVDSLLYRSSDDEPSAVRFGGGTTIEGWEYCPQFQEAVTGTEPAVCQCLFQQ